MYCGKPMTDNVYARLAFNGYDITFYNEETNTRNFCHAYNIVGIQCLFRSVNKILTDRGSPTMDDSKFPTPEEFAKLCMITFGHSISTPLDYFTRITIEDNEGIVIWENHGTS